MGAGNDVVEKKQAFWGWVLLAGIQISKGAHYGTMAGAPKKPIVQV